MSEKLLLKMMRCPACGEKIRAENDTDSVVCVYCGSVVVPVSETLALASRESFIGFHGALGVEGVKSSASALAYMDLFFEEYDWEAFAYAQSLSIVEIDKLTDSLRVMSADDKNTWFACFRGTAVPFLKKVSSCYQLFAKAVEEYKDGNMDAYNQFDAYKRISKMLTASKATVVSSLERFVANAARYGATDAELDTMKTELDTIKNSSDFEEYTQIEEIGEIKDFITQRNAEIAMRLAAEEIDAEARYNGAKELIAGKKYVEALDALRLLRGYRDSAALIEKIDKHYLISDVLEIEGNLYYLRSSSADSDVRALFPVVEKKISDKAIVHGIGRIVANYADVLYYLDAGNRLKRFHLSQNKEEKITAENAKEFTERVLPKAIYKYRRKVFLTVCKDYSETKKNVFELDTTRGTVKLVLKEIEDVVSLMGNKMIYTVLEKVTSSTGVAETKIKTSIMNVDTSETVELGAKNVTVEGFISNAVVYTQVSPNEFNRNLYIKSFDSTNGEILVEQNIYRFCDIVGDKLFYYVGNSLNHSLIAVNGDGTERREWPLYISKLLFEQSGWVYFIRKIGYNSILCKARMDGSRFTVVAPNIDRFVEIKNGYLYYINSFSALVKVRMDGSHLQELCEDVEEVLAVKEDKIVFVSIDDRIRSGEYETGEERVVKSIYAVDFSGSGKIKLAYNVNIAKKYDDNTVYYIAAEEITSSYTEITQNLSVLYRLDVKTNHSEKLLVIQIDKEKGLSGFAVAMIIMAFAFLMGFICFGAEQLGLGAFGITVGFVAMLVGIALHGKKDG